MDTQNGLSAKAQDDGQVRYVAYESVVDPTSKKELFLVVAVIKVMHSELPDLSGLEKY